jgi:hypothetical protein
MSLPKGDIVSQVSKLSNALLFSVIIGKKKRERIAALEAQAESSVRAGGNARTPSTDGAQMLPSPSKTPPDYNAVVDSSASLPSISTFDQPDCFVQPVNLDLDSSLHGDPAFTLSEDQLHDTSQYDFNFEGILDFSLLVDDSMSPVHHFLPGPSINAHPGTSSFQSDPGGLEDTQSLRYYREDSLSTLLPLTADANLEVPVLKTLQATLTVAQLLDCATTLWDPSYTRTLSLQALPANLPLNLQPTPAQLTIPHHPMLDLIPFPSMRTKLIVMFSLPAALRPPQARDDMAIMQLAFDVDDESEGLRITGEGISLGEDECEIGQKVFSNWWWACDREIVAQSNRLRQRRGAGRLRIVNAS